MREPGKWRAANLRRSTKDDVILPVFVFPAGRSIRGWMAFGNFCGAAAFGRMTPIKAEKTLMADGVSQLLLQTCNTCLTKRYTTFTRVWTSVPGTHVSDSLIQKYLNDKCHVKVNLELLLRIAL